MLVGTSLREQSLISIMLRSCQGGAVDHQCHRRRVRGSPRVDIYISIHAAVQLRLRDPRAVGVARQFVQAHFSPTKMKLVKSNSLDTKQGG